MFTDSLSVLEVGAFATPENQSVRRLDPDAVFRIVRFVDNDEAVALEVGENLKV